MKVYSSDGVSEAFGAYQRGYEMLESSVRMDVELEVGLGQNSKKAITPIMKQIRLRNSRALGKLSATSFGKKCSESGTKLSGLTSLRNISLYASDPTPYPIIQIPAHMPFRLGKYVQVFFNGIMYPIPTKNPKQAPYTTQYPAQLSIKADANTDNATPVVPIKHISFMERYFSSTNLHNQSKLHCKYNTDILKYHDKRIQNGYINYLYVCISTIFKIGGNVGCNGTQCIY